MNHNTGSITEKLIQQENKMETAARCN